MMTIFRINYGRIRVHWVGRTKKKNDNSVFPVTHGHGRILGKNTQNTIKTVEFFASKSVY
jgi:hypothetical protein